MNSNIVNMCQGNSNAMIFHFFTIFTTAQKSLYLMKVAATLIFCSRSLLINIVASEGNTVVDHMRAVID